MERLQDDIVDVDIDVRRFSSANGIDGLSEPLRVYVACCIHWINHALFNFSEIWLIQDLHSCYVFDPCKTTNVQGTQQCIIMHMLINQLSYMLQYGM